MAVGRGKFGAIRVKKPGGGAHEAGIQIYGEKWLCPVGSTKSEPQERTLQNGDLDL